ncbi:MAG: hypothetical protein MJ071_07130 [Oscillospiraceae bacterium]|nr:hypothetical protein [Oscillospiraceae bacterium]
MKKIIQLAVLLCLAMTCTACQNQENTTDDTVETTVTTENTTTESHASESTVETKKDVTTVAVSSGAKQPDSENTSEEEMLPLFGNDENALPIIADDDVPSGENDSATEPKASVTTERTSGNGITINEDGAIELPFIPIENIQ